MNPYPRSPQVTFCDPVVERTPRLQRQKRIFSKRRGVCMAVGGVQGVGWGCIGMQADVPGVSGLNLPILA